MNLPLSSIIINLKSMKVIPTRNVMSTMSHKISVASHRPQTQGHSRNGSSLHDWSARNTNYKFRNREGTHEQMRFNTEPSQTLAMNQHNTRDKTAFQARSMSLLSSLNEMIKHKKRSSRAGRRTVSQIKNTAPAKIMENFNQKMQISIPRVMILKHIMARRKQQEMVQKQKQTQFSQRDVYNRLRRVMTDVQQSYNIVDQMSDKPLRESFNKNNHCLYSRSRNKVFAAELKSKKYERKYEPTNGVVQKFSQLYYSKYMKHYDDRKKFLGGKEAMKKMVCKM